MGRPLAIWAVAALAGALGWWAFLFTLDDAYIAWRYASNLMDGHGLVWNPPPFRPVEGYSSLLWVLLVTAIWAVTGVEPPDAANPVLLGFSTAALGLVAFIGWRMPLGERLAPWRATLLALVLAGTVTNRTWLIWSSSGLETSLLTLGLLGWLAVGWFARPGAGRTAGLCALAALIELTRPDGLLFVAFAGLIALREAWVARRPAALLHALPLGIPAAHLLWRWSTYGDWLPNTYYAKHAAAWPLSGAIYLSCFLVEYALWVPLLVALVAAWRRRDGLWASIGWPGASALATLAVVGQFAYYTFDVGGDHFGFRIYQHVVPLAWLGAVFALDRGGWSARASLGALVATLGLGAVIPWTHHLRTEHLGEPKDGQNTHLISPAFPAPLRPWPMLWEAQQEWLRNHFVCIRRRGHVNYITRQQARYPSREAARSIDFGPDIPVIALNGVGYPAWVMPQVAVIDQLGLNDAVVARNPVVRSRRKMAHDRVPPAGYVDCFRPNVSARDGRVRVQRRPNALTDDDVRRCEGPGRFTDPR